MSLRKLQLDLNSAAAYEDHWPYIELIINSETKYSGFVIEHLNLEIEFLSLDTNEIILRYKNKRFGPEIWDTIIDSSGNIISDQFIKVVNIRIDQCNLNFLLKKILFNSVDGNKIDCNGFLGFNGDYIIHYTEPYYDWVHTTRLSDFKVIKKTSMSSLPFITNYVYEDNNETVSKLLNEFQETIDVVKNFSSNHSISGTS